MTKWMISRRRRPGTMVRSEWSHLRQSKLLLVAVLAIVFVPVLYAAIFLSSVWDPYGRTDTLPIAFVNQDRGVTVDGQKRAIGETIRQSLQQNKKLAWEFVDHAQASRGVQRGYYYAVVEIPADFSQQAYSLLQSSSRQPVIHYTVTPAKNYVGSVISRQAAQAIKNDVAQQLTQAYTKEIMSRIGGLGDGLHKAGNGAAQLQYTMTQFQAGLGRYTGGVSQLATQQQKVADGLGQLQAAATTLQQGIGQLQQQLPTDHQVGQLTQGVARIQQAMTVLQRGLDVPPSAEQQLVTQDARALAESLRTLPTDVTSAGAVVQKAMQQAAVAGGTTTITLPELQTMAVVLQRTQQIGTQAQTLLTHLQALTTTMAGQQQVFKTSVNQLTHGMNQLAPQVTTALNGYRSLRAGSERLGRGAGQITYGMAAAQQGSRQLAAGAARLAGSSGQLLHGSQQLTQGSAILADRLYSGAASVTLLPAHETLQARLATPATAAESQAGHVPNYGYAMAPYMLSLALFVGSLTLTTIYPVRRIFAQPENAWQWWLAKISVLTLVVLAQATVMMAIVIGWVGLQPEQLGHFVATGYLAALAFMSIVALLVIAFDNPGRLMVMILLVLQLAASEGIFPIQTAPQFFQAIHPWLPMTHSIIAFRQAISGGISQAMYGQHMMALGCYVVVANLLLVGFLWRRGRRKFDHTSVDGDE